MKWSEVKEYIMSIDTYDTNTYTVAEGLQKLVEYLDEHIKLQE